METDGPGWDERLAPALRGTGCLVDADSVARSDGGVIRITVSSLTASLRDGTTELTLGWDDPGRRWRIVEPRDFARDQRIRRGRVDETAADRGVRVDRIFADRLRAIPDRTVSRRALFALSQCQERRNTLIANVSHTAIRDGIAFATVDLSREVTWRLGEIRIRERRLPETLMPLLKGRTVRDIVDLPGLGAAVVHGVRSTPEGIVVRCAAETERYGDVWRDLGGE